MGDASDGHELLICPSCQAVFRTGYRACPHDGTRLMATTTDPLVGTELAGRYRIEALLGDGGLGRVYRARHARMSRRYALKVLYGDVAYDPKVRTRFANEAEAASRLSHPNVVGVVDFGETEAGLLYLAMDLAEGSSLADVIAARGRIPPSEALRLFRELVLGLAHAHERGLIHRDLKPENIIIERRGGQPRIVDFGLALLQEQPGGRVTTGGMVIGTPHYMAPEQATGETIDQRTDLFSLGLVLYEMLAGVLPFEGPALEVARMNLTVAPPALAVRVPGLVVEPGLEALCMKLLAKRPKDRPDSALAVLAMIDRLGPQGATDQKLTWVDGVTSSPAGSIALVEDPPDATGDLAAELTLGEALPPEPVAADAPTARAVPVTPATPVAPAMPASAVPASAARLDPDDAGARRAPPLTTDEIAATVRRRPLAPVALGAIAVAALALVGWRLTRSSRTGAPVASTAPADAGVAVAPAPDAAEALDAGALDAPALDAAGATPVDGGAARVAIDAPIARLPVDAGARPPSDAAPSRPPIDAAARAPIDAAARPPIDAAPAPAGITEAAIKTGYRAVGKQLDALEARSKTDQVKRLRRTWLDLPYLDAVSNPGLRAEFMARLRALEAEIARVP